MANPGNATRARAAKAIGARVLFLLLGLAGLAGCASTESDIPWNAPQPWEGAPGIPGFTPDESR
jgi:hypothetical protein